MVITKTYAENDEQTEHDVTTALRELKAGYIDILLLHYTPPGEHGLERASLYTWSGNVAALKVLKSLGFRVSHEWQILTKSIGV